MIQGNPSNCDKGHMQPYSSKKANRVAWILKSRSREQLKRIRLTENVAFIVWFVRIMLDNKVKMQLFRQNQGKRVVTNIYHKPITKNLELPPLYLILNLFLWNFHVTRKVLGGMRINARVSGMRSLHADTPVRLWAGAAHDTQTFLVTCITPPKIIFYWITFARQPCCSQVVSAIKPWQSTKNLCSFASL